MRINFLFPTNAPQNSYELTFYSCNKKYEQTAKYMILFQRKKGKNEFM